MAEIKINNSDLKALNKKLDALKKLSQQEFSNEIAATAAFSSTRAKKSAPLDQGGLRQSIGFGKAGNKASVFAKVHYAPYVEFGTGKKVDLDDMKQLGIPDAYAAQFKGKGIKEVNLPARPFFFPSVRIELKKLLKRLDKKLNDLTR